MTKKSIFRDHFSWKVRTFADAFSQRHHFILLNYPAELQPRKGFNEQIQISIGAAHHSADSTIGYLGLLQAWQDIWDGGCAFFMPIPIVLPPYQTLMREL